MIIVISPAKTLDLETKIPNGTITPYVFKEEAQKVAKKMKTVSKKKLGALMNISDNLAELNFNRFQNWQVQPQSNDLRPAIYTFKGEVYLGLDAYSMNQDELDFAQDHLRILSGMYGLLRPLDGIQPYRLEMGTKINVGRRKNLYDFWLDKIAKELNQTNQEVLVNLASTEYFKAINLKELNMRVITPVFKDFKNGKLKVISFFAKNARGLMAKWMIQNKIEHPEKIKDFQENGYRFSETESTEREWVFTR